MVYRSPCPPARRRSRTHVQNAVDCVGSAVLPMDAARIHLAILVKGRLHGHIDLDGLIQENRLRKKGAGNTLARRLRVRKVRYEKISACLGWNRPRSKHPAPVNSTPFVRQYDILSNRWGDFICQREYPTNGIHRSSRNM